MDRIQMLVALVEKTVTESGKGCQEFVLRAQGFTNKEIDTAKNSLLIESKKGKNGGLFLFGQKPANQERGESLREEAFDFIQSLLDNGKLNAEDKAKAEELILRRMEETEKRSKAKAA